MDLSLGQEIALERLPIYYHIDAQTDRSRLFKQKELENRLGIRFLMHLTPYVHTYIYVIALAQ